MKQSLSVQDFEVWVHLGCTKEEQKFAQPVHISVELEYDGLVKGSASDELQDATDYVQLTNLIKTCAESKPFHLVEHLNDTVMNSMLNYLRGIFFKGQVVLSVRKLRVPVENLRSGVVFKCVTQL